MKLHVTMLREAEEPLLPIRNYYVTRARYAGTVWALLMVWVTLFFLRAVIANDAVQDPLFPLIAPLILLVDAVAYFFISDLWSNYVVFCMTSVMAGHRLRRWLFFRPRFMYYHEIHEVSMTRNVFRPAIRFGSSLNPMCKVLFVPGFTKASLKPALMVLKDKVEPWAFDEELKELIREFEEEDQRPKRLDE